MLDLYLVIVPIFGLLTFLTLMALKYTLNEPKVKDLKKYQKAQQQKNSHIVKPPNNDTSQQIGYKKTLFYLLRNFTLADLCLIRRSRNKLPLLLSFSIIAILSFLINLPFVFCFIGTTITVIFVLGKMLTNDYNESELNSQINIRVKQQSKFQYKLEVIYTFLALTLNVLLIGLVYKNYRNSLLLATAQNFLITVALDNFLVKPLLLALFAFPIKNIQFVDTFINTENQIVEIIHQQRILKKVLDAKISALSPKKLRNSPSKVPKAHFEIEPKVNTDDKENNISTLDLTKNMKKPRLSPLSLKKKLQIPQQGDCSLISILNSNQKKRKPNNGGNISFGFDKTFQEKVQEQPAAQPLQQGQGSKFNFESRKKNKLYSSKMIMINPDSSIIYDLNDVQNQQQEDYNKSTLNNKLQKSQKSLKDSEYNKNYDGLKISLNKSIDNDYDEENQQYNPYNRPYTTFEQDNSIIVHGGGGVHTSRRTGLLKIHQDRNGQDLEEIDLNSPQRRKQKLSKVVQQGQRLKAKKKKAYKKYSLDPNRHVIKHSTGQPYLEFLPNLLNKQREQKKKRTQQQASQQQFSRKLDLLYSNNGQDSRLIKSVKRSKNSKDPIVRENDENRIPEFIIEDFEA